MIISFYDKTIEPIYIDDDRGSVLKKIVMDSKNKFVDITDHGTFAISDIRSMIPGGCEPYKSSTPSWVHSAITNQSHLIETKPDITWTMTDEEVRKFRIKRIKKMKQDFLNRKDKK